MHRLAERGDRLLVPPLHQVHEAVERDQPGLADRRVFLDVVAVEGVEEQRGPDPLVEVLAALAERLQLLAGQRASRRGWRLAIRSRTERSRIAGSELVIVSIRVLPSEAMVVSPARSEGRSASRQRPGAGQRRAFCSTRIERFEQDGEDLLAVDAGQRQGDLGLDHAELDAQVEPRPAGLERQVLLAPGQGVQGRRELDLPQLADVVADQVVEQLEDGGREHVHAEEAEVVPGPQAGDLEPQLGQGRVRLLDDLVDDVDVGTLGQPPAGQRAVLVDQVLAGGLHGGDRAVLRGRPGRSTAGRTAAPRRRDRGGRPGAAGTARRPTNSRAHQTAWP